MNPQRVWVCIAAGLGILSALLPWVSIGLVSVSGTSGGDGLIVIGLFVVGLITALSHPRGEPLGRGGRTTVLLVGLLGAGVGGWKIVQVGEASRGMFRASPGVGLYLMIVAGLAMFILGLRSVSPSKPPPTMTSDSVKPASDDQRLP